jgi:hypothetical protein
MPSEQEEQKLKHDTLENDRRVRDAEHRRILREGTTMHAYAQADAAIPRGRFAQVEATTVIGSKSDAAAPYPAASAAHQTELSPEPPLGYAIDEMVPFDPSTVSHSPAVEDSGGAPSSAFLPEDVAAPPPFSRDDGEC